MPIPVPGGQVFEPDDLALLRRAFALAADGDGALGCESRALAARSLFAAFAAGERDVAVLANLARRRLIERPTVVRVAAKRIAATA